MFIPQIAEVVKQNAELAWTQTTPDHFRVSYSGEGFPEAIDLRQDMLGKWTVEFSSGFKKTQKIAKTQDSLPEAFAAAEKWMSVNRPRVYRNKSQKAGWRKARPSDAQVREIRRQGLNLNWQNMTSGEVSDVLDFRKAQQLARARARAGAA